MLQRGDQRPLNTASNVGRIGFRRRADQRAELRHAAKWDINNNLRRQTAVGSLGAVGIGNGEFVVSGSLNSYFGDKTVLDKITNNTLTSLRHPARPHRQQRISRWCSIFRASSCRRARRRSAAKTPT
jgi:hypothetical protein